MDTTSASPTPVLEPSDDTVPSPPQRAVREKRHWVVPVVVGAVAFTAGFGLGSNLTWRFSGWWKQA